MHGDIYFIRCGHIYPCALLNLAFGSFGPHGGAVVSTVASDCEDFPGFDPVGLLPPVSSSVRLHVLSVFLCMFCLWVGFLWGRSGFLPQSKDTQVRLKVTP